MVLTLLSLIAAAFIGRQMKLARLKNDLIANVTHELKTPLASMRVLVDTLIDGRLPEESQRREYLEMIAKENIRLSRLIDNFLTYSRIERSKIAFVMEDADPADIAADAAEALQERLASPNCHFESKIAPDLPPINADRDAMVSALLNLLDNALKYSGDEKEISLRVFGQGGKVRFEVADNGVGLSRGELKRIFDRFYQADLKLSRQAGGCGLGLGIVKFIAESHGGSIHATSRAKEGSVFTIEIPAANEREGRR